MTTNGIRTHTRAPTMDIPYPGIEVVILHERRAIQLL